MKKPLRSRRGTLAEVGELSFLDRLLPTLPVGRGSVVGPGDDCAVTRGFKGNVLLTTDALVEGSHFERAWMTPRQIGRKAYLVNASDIAAMGGRPRFCLVSVGVAADFPAADLTAIHRGIADAAAADSAWIVGGNLARASDLFVSITLVGEMSGRPVVRSGGRPGDALYVTGTLGEAALGLQDLQADPSVRSTAVRRFREPTPRVAAGIALAGGLASAMIDVSDGLLQDLQHLCEAGGVGAEIFLDSLPCSARVRREAPMLALHGGEDYELLFAVPQKVESRLRGLQRRLGCRLTRIGRLLAKRHGLRVYDASGEIRPVDAAGFDHFHAGATRVSSKGARKPRAGSVRVKRRKV
jgi:thiamine-monophosphate kinase